MRNIYIDNEKYVEVHGCTMSPAQLGMQAHKSPISIRNR